MADRGELEPEDLGLVAPSQNEIIPLADAKDRFARQYVLDALAQCGGNRTRAAQLLGSIRARCFVFWNVKIRSKPIPNRVQECNMKHLIGFILAGGLCVASPSALADSVRLEPASPSPVRGATSAYEDPDFRYDLRIELPIIGVGLGGWIATELTKPQLGPQTCRWCDRAPDGSDSLNPIDAGSGGFLCLGIRRFLIRSATSPALV